MLSIEAKGPLVRVMWNLKCNSRPYFVDIEVGEHDVYTANEVIYRYKHIFRLEESGKHEPSVGGIEEYLDGNDGWFDDNFEPYFKATLSCEYKTHEVYILLPTCYKGTKLCQYLLTVKHERNGTLSAYLPNMKLLYQAPLEKASRISKAILGHNSKEIKDD